MLLNNLESLSFVQIRESYPNVNINEIKNQDGNMDMFLTYLLTDNRYDIKELVKEYEFKPNLDKPIKISDVLDFNFFKCEKLLKKDKEIFPPLSKKVNAIQYAIFLNYYINKYIVDTEIYLLENNKRLEVFFDILFNSNKNFLYLKDDDGHTVGDYLLLFLTPLSMKVFEKYDNKFNSINKTSKKYIDSIIDMVEKADFKNQENIIYVNRLFNITVNEDMFLSSITEQSQNQLQNFCSILSAYNEKGKIEKKVVKSKKKNNVVKF